MKLLLDTHIWLWALDHPRRLDRGVWHYLENPANEIYLSPISIWEAHQLVRRKRLHVSPTFPEWLKRVFERIPVREAPLNFEVAAEMSNIELPQSDPGDLMIAATASLYGFTLVTADRQLLRCSWLKTLAC
jgi:PIN domain nuclease of toxin-antitoxin system